MDPSKHHHPFQNIPPSQSNGRIPSTSSKRIPDNNKISANSKVTTSGRENCPRELYPNHPHNIPASKRAYGLPGYPNFNQPQTGPPPAAGPMSYFQPLPSGQLPPQQLPVLYPAQRFNGHPPVPSYGAPHNHHIRPENTAPRATIKLPPLSEMMPKRFQNPVVQKPPEPRKKPADYTVPTPKSLPIYPQSAFGYLSQTRIPAVFGSSLPFPSVPSLPFSTTALLADTTPRSSKKLTGNINPTMCSDKPTSSVNEPLPQSSNQEHPEKPSNDGKESRSDKSPKKSSNAVAISNEEIYKEYGKLTGHQLSISAVEFSSCGTYLASASADKTVRVWEMQSFACVRVLQGHEQGINDISWSSDSIFLVSASDDKTLKIYNVVEGTCVRTLRGHTHFVFCCVYNPQGSMILSGSFDESLRLWNAVTGVCMKVMPAHTDPVTTVDFNRDGSLFASGAYDGFIRIWEAANGRCCATLKTPDYAPITYLRYSPNGKWLLTSSLDGFVRIWCTNRNSIVKEYSGHSNVKYCIPVDFSVTQEHCVIGGSEDGRIFIWDLQMKHILQIIDGHSEAVLALDCNPRKSLFATGSIESDTDIRIWKHV